MRILIAAALSLVAAVSPSAFAPPSLRVAYGGAGQPVRGFYPGIQNMVVAAARLHASVDEPINVNSVSWNYWPPGFNSFVASARLVHDANGNARVDEGEPALVPALLPPYSAPRLVFSASPLLTIPPGESRDILLVLDINPDVGNGVLIVSLNADSSSIGALGQTTFTAAAITGATVSNNALRQEDPSMVCLPGLRARFEAERHLFPNNGSLLNFQWDFENDGTFDFTSPTTPVAEHVYPTEGPVTAKLRLNFLDGTFVDRSVTGSVKALDGEIQTIDPDPAASPRMPWVRSIIGRPSTNRLYAVDEFSGVVTEVDAITGTIAARFSMDPGGGVNPGGIMAVSEPHGRLYVFDEGLGNAVPHRLICMNLATRAIETTIALPLSSFVDSMTINNTTQLLYATLAEAGSVVAIDVNPASPAFHTIVATVNLDFCTRLAIDGALNRVYIPANNQFHIHVMNGATHEIAKSVQVPPGNGQLVDLVHVPAANRIYQGRVAFGPQNPPLQVFNTNTETLEASIPMPGSIQGLAVRQIAPHKAYAVIGHTNQVKVIGPALTIVSTITLPESHSAGLVAADLDDVSGRLYLMVWEDSGYSTRYVIDTITDTLVHSAAHTARHVLEEEKTERSTALFSAAGRYWVAYEGGILVGYDTATHAAVATISTLGAPTGAYAFDPNDGKLVYTHSGPYGLRKADPLSGAQLMSANTGPWTSTNFAFNGGATHAYVLNLSGTSKGLKAVKMSDGSVMDIALSPDAIVSGFLGVNPATQHLFVSLFKKSTGGFVAVVDVNPASPTFNTELSVVSLGAGTQPFSLDVDSSTDKVYVVQGTGGTSALFRIQDGATPPSTALTLPDGGGFADGDLAVNPDTKRVFFGTSQGVLVYDTQTDTSVGTINVSFALDVAVSRVLNRVYVKSEDSDEIQVFDGTTLAPVATIETFGDVGDFLVADHLDTIYCPLEDGFQVIRASTNEALGVISDIEPTSGFLSGTGFGTRWSGYWSAGPALSVVPSPFLDRIKIFGPGGGDAMAPEIGSVSGPSGAAQAGQPVEVSATFTDDGTGHTAEWFWGDGTSSPGTITPTCEVTAYQVTGSHVYAAAGIYTITLFVRDGAGHETPAELQVVVVDRAAGSVTANGWIPSPVGAVIANPQDTGKAYFNLKSEYKKDEATPSGHVKFDFKTAGIDFTASAQEWLVVSGSLARVRGTGTLEGVACRFQATLIDGQAPGGGDKDKFRIRIWRSDTGAILYDNQPGQSLEGNAAAPIGGGSISIQK